MLVELSVVPVGSCFEGVVEDASDRELSGAAVWVDGSKDRTEEGFGVVSEGDVVGDVEVHQRRFR